MPVFMGSENREGLNESQPGRTSKLLLDEHPHINAGYHLTLHGEVTKIQSGGVFVKTPVGHTSSTPRPLLPMPPSATR
jgi:hypothetical protein